MKTYAKFIEDIESIDNEALVFVFSSDMENIESVYSRISSLSSNFVFVSTDGEILNNNITNKKSVVSVIEFDKTEFEIVYSKEDDSFLKGRDLASKFSRKPNVMLVFSDAFYTNGEKFLKGIYSVFDDVTLSGGMAGDNSEFIRTFVGCKDGLFDKGAVAVGLFNDELEFENYSSLGWVPVGIEHKVSKSKDNIIYEIDNKPAIEFYKRYLGEMLAKELPRIGIEFPLMVKRDNQLTARAVLGVGEDGSIRVGGDIKEGENIYIGIGFLEKILINHLEQLKNQDYEIFFIFSCMARKRFLGDSVVKEIEPFAKKALSVGFFTYGEFYNKYFLNQTFTLCALRESKNLKKEPKKISSSTSLDPKDFYYLGLVNILNTLVKDFYEKDLQIKQLQKALEIKTELINNVENIENITTFELDLNHFDEKRLEGIKSHKPYLLSNLDEKNRKKLIKYLKCPTKDDFIEIKSQNGNSYLIFAKKNEGKVYGVIVDISSIRKKDEMLISQSRLAQMGEMINMIAHQWRQPINAISATIIKLQLMMEMGEVSKEELAESLEFISKTIQNISKTIDEFLNFSKPVSNCEEFGIEEVIENIMKLVLVQLHNHNIQVELDFEKFRIKSYKKEIEHILLNLLTNARDVLDKKSGSKIIYIRAYKKGELSYIEIEDNGGGIKIEPIERIFEPYFTTKESGTGLGLYLSKKIAKEKLKGDLVVENREDGALFRLILRDICEVL